ncbi:Spy/CpxP family protein refolding chaperone [Thalassotalea atypica]|uniref:Spy/CpxP family protein refolding chaperone n=1 Tax=Thalassotalea atypica TaxID=2054316 RepID=UPI002574343A|nr:Spy/CpxP family protein refolding chaperone [Thalassotalea atypica]
MTFKNTINSQKIILSALLCAVINTPTTVLAEEISPSIEPSSFHQKHHRMDRKVFKKMVKYLKLNEDQVTQIKIIREQAKVDGAAIKLNIKPFFESAASLKNNTIFDEQTFNEMYAQYQDEFASMALHKAKVKHAIYHVLTPEQQAKWDDFKAKRQEKRKGKF